MIDNKWEAHIHADGYEDKVYITNDDFTHDVWLWVTGDFASVDQKFLYAVSIVDALNSIPQLEKAAGLSLQADEKNGNEV